MTAYPDGRVVLEGQRAKYSELAPVPDANAWIDSATFRASVSGVLDGKWHHYAFVDTGSTAVLYVDGTATSASVAIARLCCSKVKDGEFSFYAGGYAPCDSCLAPGGGGGTSGFDASKRAKKSASSALAPLPAPSLIHVDEVAVFTRALTPQEVLRHSIIGPVVQQQLGLTASISRITTAGASGDRRYSVKLEATGLSPGVPITFNVLSPGHGPVGAGGAAVPTMTVTPATDSYTWAYELTNPRGVFQAQVFVDADRNNVIDDATKLKNVEVK